MQAKLLGTSKSIAVVRRINYMKLLDVAPIDAIVNRNEALSSVIISAVRYPGSASTLALMEQIGAETIQVTIPDDSPAAGIELKNLSMPTGALIGLVIREERRRSDVFIPTGNSSLKPGDKAILFVTQDVIEETLATLGVNTA
jgi:trk system potassium uptake protein TrkA